MRTTAAAVACLVCAHESAQAAPLPPLAAGAQRPGAGTQQQAAALPDGEPQFAALPFALSEVTLTPGSRLANQMGANSNWLLALNESRLTCLSLLRGTILSRNPSISSCCWGPVS